MVPLTDDTPPAAHAAAPRILIVDDQTSNVRLLEQTLRRAGYTDVMATIAPREVVALHSRHHYDLILLDLQMPELDGFGVMKALRDIRRVHVVSILVISADPAQTSAALQAGADGFLSKPFRLPDVVGRVQFMLEKAGAARAALVDALVDAAAGPGSSEDGPASGQEPGPAAARA